MRSMFLLRGAPGCGKSTWIHDNGLEQYTVSSDAVRLMMRSPTHSADGSPMIPQDDGRIVWGVVKTMVETRMKHGDLIILDATNKTKRDMSAYSSIAQANRYDMYVVDFTDIPLETCLKRNRTREDIKRVPESIIRKYFDDIDGTSDFLPHGYASITRSEALSLISYGDKNNHIDASEYKAVNLIGDIHACYNALENVLHETGAENGSLRNDELYVFCGDYLDRGPDACSTISFLMKIATLPNVVLLEGNHEAHLRAYSKSMKARSNVFNTTTAKALDEAGWISRKDIRRFCRRLRACALIEFHGKKIYACHGGLSFLPDRLLCVSDEELISGTGGYADTDASDATWESNCDGAYLVHGHRAGCSIHPSEHVYNLEGGVERGGEIRCVRFTNTGEEKILTASL